MSVSPAVGPQYCYGTACNLTFVTIRGPNGQGIGIDAPICGADCATCTSKPCPPMACAAPARLTSTGATRVWDGTDWLGGTCGAGVSCQSRSCAAPGKYVATMCAYLDSSPNTFCNASSQNALCEDFPFDWPPPGGNSTVKWVIGDADAGLPPRDAGPACFSSVVTEDFKGCASSIDCVTRPHLTDCCGARHYVGVSSWLSSEFDSCEAAWDKQLPVCNCLVAPLSTTDDGQLVADPSKVVAYCVTSLSGLPKTCVTTLQGTGADAGGKGGCGSTADCPAGSVCGFPRSPVCAPLGECFPAPQATCNAYSAGCACDGSTINIACNGLPAGYEIKPLRRAGACVDGG
jgi:hypothetical protein